MIRELLLGGRGVFHSAKAIGHLVRNVLSSIGPRMLSQAFECLVLLFNTRHSQENYKGASSALAEPAVAESNHLVQGLLSCRSYTIGWPADTSKVE